MKNQTIGVEIEMNNITREKAARKVAEYFGTRAWNAASEYGYYSWACKDGQGRVWKFQRDVSIYGPDAEKCELVTPILTYDAVSYTHLDVYKRQEYDRPKSNKDHPTMKPIGLMSYPIRNSTMTNGIVLDPFLGSGSTLIACEETDRVCRGIELDPKFVDVIVKRYIEHSDGHYDDVFVVRDGQKLKFEEVATFEPEREVADGE